MAFDAPTPIQKKKLPIGKLLVLGVLVLAAGGAIWWGLQKAGAIGMPDDPQTIEEAQTFFGSQDFNELSIQRQQTYIDRARTRFGEDAMIPVLMASSESGEREIDYANREEVAREVMHVMFEAFGEAAVEWAKADTPEAREAMMQEMFPRLMMRNAALLMTLRQQMEADPEGMQEVMGEVMADEMRSFTQSGNPQHAALIGEMFSDFQESGFGGGRRGGG